MSDDFDDFDVDDILGNNAKRKKKKNSGRKGKRGEANLIDQLEIRFPGLPFSRTIGSGNRWSQTKLTETAKQVFTGDVVTPDNFLFVLECKHGYNGINLDRAVKKGNKLLESFLSQVEKDGIRVGKKPLLCWKKDYEPWVVFLKNHQKGTRYKEWSFLPLEDLLSEPDEFFFK